MLTFVLPTLGARLLVCTFLRLMMSSWRLVSASSSPSPVTPILTASPATTLDSPLISPDSLLDGQLIEENRETFQSTGNVESCPQCNQSDSALTLSTLSDQQAQISGSAAKEYNKEYNIIGYNNNQRKTTTTTCVILVTRKTI